MMYEELIQRLRSHNGWALNKTLDEAADAIEELTAQTRWIPVTERLPEIGETVLVLAYGYDVFTAKMLDQTEYGYPVFECSGFFRELAKPGRITHWMPLLAAPKEE